MFEVQHQRNFILCLINYVACNFEDVIALASFLSLLLYIGLLYFQNHNNDDDDDDNYCQ